MDELKTDFWASALIRRAEARVVGHGGRSIEFPLTSGNLG